MSVDVKCSCGQVVVADNGQRGQVLQCPYCLAGVAVPVATAGRQPTSPQDRQSEAVAMVVIGLAMAAAGYFLLWHLPFGKLLVLGGVFTAGNAGRHL